MIMKIDIQKLTDTIITEGLAVETSNTYAFPTAENESNIFLILALGEVVRNSDKHVTGVQLSDADHDTMIKAGVKVIEGSMSPEAYAKKIQSITGTKLSDMVLNQIAARVALSYGKGKPALKADKKK